MAISTSFIEYRGLSSDTKPTQNPAGSGAVYVGSTFYEIDTGDTYQFNGTSWVAYTGGSSSEVTNAGTFPVQVSSNAYRSAPTVTRAANTTPYTAGDVVGGAITFTSVGPSGGHVLVTTADLRIDISAVPSGMTTFRLYFYDVTPPSGLADNAVFDLPSGDRSAYLGYLDLPTVADLGATVITQTLNPGLHLKLATASTSVFAYLVTIGAFTPAGNSEVYTPRLKTVGV
jgi:hypothetical protein